MWPWWAHSSSRLNLDEADETPPPPPGVEAKAEAEAAVEAATAGRGGVLGACTPMVDTPMAVARSASRSTHLKTRSLAPTPAARRDPRSGARSYTAP